MNPFEPFGIPPAKLRERPYLHLDLMSWRKLRRALTEQPSEPLQLCRYDARPGPNRPPRHPTAILEAAALVAAVTEGRSDRQFLQTHLDLVLPTRGMELIGVARGQFLAALAFCHDLLGEVLDEPARAALRRTLADHARRSAEAVRVGFGENWPRESPPVVAILAGLSLAALALLREEPEAADWLATADQHLSELLAVIALDGWWPTGFEDWNLLLPLLTRVADAWQRLAGRDLFAHGLFEHAWAVATHGVAPNGIDALEFDGVGRSDLSRREAAALGQRGGHYRWRREPCTWALDRLARQFSHPGFRLAAERWRQLGLGRGSAWTVLFPAISGAWPGIQPDRPYHLFAAHGLAVWREDWRAEALAVAFAAGPAYGLEQPDWSPTSRLDADANQVLLWAEGEPLVIDTGALPDPASAYHNTVLVNGQGQRYPDQRDPARLEAAWLNDHGGALVGQAGAAYPTATGLRGFARHLAFAPGYVVIWDQLTSGAAARFEWLLHTHGTIAPRPETAEARLTVGEVGLQIQVLRPHRARLEVREIAPRAAAEPIAAQLRVSLAEAAVGTQFLVLLATCPAQGACPVEGSLLTGESAVGCRLVWDSGEREDVLFPPHGRGIALDSLLSDAASLALRYAADGDWRRLIARRVSEVLIPGGQVVTASQPVDLALLAGADQLTGDIDAGAGATVTVRCPFVPRGVLVDGQSGRARIEREARLVSVRLTAGRHDLRINGRAAGG